MRIAWTMIRYDRRDYVLSRELPVVIVAGPPARIVSEDVPIDVTAPTVPEAAVLFRRAFARMSGDLAEAGLVVAVKEAPDEPGAVAGEGMTPRPNRGCSGTTRGPDIVRAGAGARTSTP